MAKPNNSIANVKLPGDSSNRPIIPYKVTDGTNVADCPNLNGSDQTIATRESTPQWQETMTIVASALTNINGRTLSNYTATLSTSPYYKYTITYGNTKCTEEQARNYMEYMTGSRYLPQYDYEKPKNSIFMFSDRTF